MRNKTVKGIWQVDKSRECVLIPVILCLSMSVRWCGVYQRLTNILLL